MASRAMHIFLLVFLTFSLMSPPVAAVNTTQFDNFTIVWETFSIFNCSVQATLSVSSFTCVSNRSLSVDDSSCLNEGTYDFNETTCQMTSSTAPYTSEAPTTKQSVASTQIQTSTATAPMTTQRTTTIITTAALSSIITAVPEGTAVTTSATPGAAPVTTAMTPGAVTTAPTTTPVAAITTQSTTAAATSAATASPSATTTTIASAIQTSSGSIANVTETSTVTTVHSTTAQSPTTNTTVSLSTTTTLSWPNSTAQSSTTSASVGSTTISTTPAANLTGNTASTTTTSVTSASLITSTTTLTPYTCPKPRDDYIGTYCNVSSDACAMSDPCLNDAACYPNDTFPYGYYCQCQPGYAGYNCQYDGRACKENTCWHNGTCIAANATRAANNGSSFTCECVVGYNGLYCQLKVDLCGNITCENRGVCSTTGLTWECLCLDPTLYYGQYCQFKSNKLKILEILSKSFASIAIAAIIATCTFVVVMDVLKYCFHIDPVEYERESYRRRRAYSRRMKQPVNDKEPKFALRFQYVS